MKYELLAVTLLLLTSFSAAESYMLEIQQNNGNLEMQNLSLVDTEAEISEEGRYTATLQLFNGTEAASTHFSIPEISYAVTLNPNVSEGTPGENSGAIVLLPYHPSGNLIQVEDTEDGEQEFVSYVSRYSSCNQNTVCEEGENTGNCPYDCSETGEQPDGDEEKGFFEKIIDAILGFIDWIIPV